MRAASLAYFLYKYNSTMKKLDGQENLAKDLEQQDKQFGDWGWRVASKIKDEDFGEDYYGKYYVKEIDAQIYNSRFDGSISSTYTENKNETKSEIINQRKIVLSDTLKRNFNLRYDITSPDPTIELSQHTYEYIADIAFNQGLAQDGKYRSVDVGQTVTKEQEWITPH
jgi:hypothetical protein